MPTVPSGENRHANAWRFASSPVEVSEMLRTYCRRVSGCKFGPILRPRCGKISHRFERDVVHKKMITEDHHERYSFSNHCCVARYVLCNRGLCPTTSTHRRSS